MGAIVVRYSRAKQTRERTSLPFYYAKFSVKGRAVMLRTDHRVNDPKGYEKALKDLAKLEERAIRGEWQPRVERRHFHELCAAYLERPNLRVNTRNEYTQVVTDRLQPHFGNVELSTITREKVRQYQKWASEQDSRSGGKLSPSTVNRDMMLLSALLAFAVNEDWIVKNPARGVPRLTAQTVSRPILTIEQAGMLLKATTSLRDYALILLAVASGMRQGELLCLRWRNVDFERRTLHVCESVRKGRVTAPKTRKSIRTLAFGETVAQVLLAWRQELDKQVAEREARSIERQKKGKSALVWCGEDLVFPSEAGTHQKHYNLLRRVFWPALKRAGLMRIPFHSLRHTAASQLAAAGVTDAEVRDVLGHATTVVTTGVYIKPLPGAGHATAARMEHLWASIGSTAVSPRVTPALEADTDR